MATNSPNTDSGAGYRNLVRSLAMGAEPEFDRVLVVLASVGRTPHQLASDVAAYRQAVGGCGTVGQLARNLQ